MSQREKMPRTTRWVREARAYPQSPEQAHASLQHPTMQQLRTALQILGAASRDVAWMQENDPHNELRQAMEIVVRLTSLSPR
jgi:hypothetical protein